MYLKSEKYISIFIIDWVMILSMDNILNRFIRYAKIDTQSDESSNTIPSTLKQLDLLNLLYLMLFSMKYFYLLFLAF